MRGHKGAELLYGNVRTLHLLYCWRQRLRLTSEQNGLKSHTEGRFRTVFLSEFVQHPVCCRPVYRETPSRSDRESQCIVWVTHWRHLPVYTASEIKVFTKIKKPPISKVLHKIGQCCCNNWLLAKLSHAYPIVLIPIAWKTETLCSIDFS